MLEKMFGFSRFEKINLEQELILRASKEVTRPSIHEFRDSISPIWEKVVGSTGKHVESLVADPSPRSIRHFYEAFFLNGLSDGAAVGVKMSDPRTLMKLVLRERKRLNHLEGLAIGYGFSLATPFRDFGCPWGLNIGGKLVNFEMTDHMYFALVLHKLIQRSNARELIFLGDGCGYLAQAVAAIMPPGSIDKAIFIDLYHFLVRQFLLWEMNQAIPAEYLNGEASHYPLSTAAKVLINQDSLVEITERQQDKYFTYMKENNVKMLASYNKYDASVGHHDFRESANRLFGKPLVVVPSPVRKGYWFEIWATDDCF